MQYEVDNYILEYVENEEKYYISFEDSARQKCRIEIAKEIFDEYMISKKAYVKIKNETSRHLEQSELSDIEIYKRAFKPEDTVEDIVIKNIDKEKLKQAKKELSEKQVRRIDLHIVNEVTIRDIANIEKVQKSQIQKSLKLGLKNLRKFFEK
jgi:RNA polymerase sigma-70 factor (ECF subfamily)